MSEKNEFTGIFGGARDRLDDDDGITVCLFCKKTSKETDIVPYYNQNYCLTCKEEAKAIRADKAAKKKGQTINVNEIVSKVQEGIKTDLISIKEEIQKIGKRSVDTDGLEVADEMKDMLVAVATQAVREQMENMPPIQVVIDENMRKQLLPILSQKNIEDEVPSEGAILRALYRSKSKYTILNRLSGIWGAPSYEECQEILETMAKNRDMTNSNGQSLGKLLWKNPKGCYVMNPHIPKDIFIQLTGMTDITEENFDMFVKLTIKKATKYKGTPRENDLNFKEWIGTSRKDKKEKDPTRNIDWHIVPVRKEVIDRVNKKK